MKDPICYCFHFNRDDIVRDFKKHGKSLIIEKISTEKKLNQCDCAVKNPKGR